jgi:hypothetical protein
VLVLALVVVFLVVLKSLVLHLRLVLVPEYYLVLLVLVVA